MGSIALDPKTKIPPAIVAKGKTKLCEKKYGNKGKDLMLHSLNGLSTTAVMKKYLRWIWKKMGKSGFALIIDVYKSHINKSVKNYAKKLGIKLIFVPACGTGSFQLLDHRIFAILKNSNNYIFLML